MLERAPDAPALLTRLFVGYFFLETGVSKVQNLDAMTQRFIEWGIPAPAFTAALSGYTELIGGALIVLGLFTRLASIPMIINMIVAVVSVKLQSVTALSDFVELDEPFEPALVAMHCTPAPSPSNCHIDVADGTLNSPNVASRLTCVA